MSSPKDNTPWNRAEAVHMLGLLEPRLADLGFHCALGGSVLYRGHSSKDLDVIVYPHTAPACGDGWSRIIRFLARHFDSEIHPCESTSQIRDGKNVAWLKTAEGQRIDFFFLQ